MKFGGSVIADGRGFYSVAKYTIGLTHKHKPLAVVSAPKGVTSVLTILHRQPNRKAIQNLGKRYATILSTIRDKQIRNEATTQIEDALRSLKNSMSYDRFVSQGEDHSGIILTHFMKSLGHESEYLDGYNVGIVADSKGMIREELSIINVRNNLKKYLDLDNKTIPVVGGFVGKDLDTTRYRLLGRNSTDVTGAVVAAATEAEYQIVKDVSGIYFVEPEFRKSDVIPFLSYKEAGELAWRGIEAVHPIAVRIAENQKMAIRVKSLGDSPSTLISRRSMSTQKKPVVGISARRFHMLTVSDELMDTTEGRGYLSNVTRILSNCGIDIYDVATSANVISVTIRPQDRLIDNKSVETILTDCLREHSYEPTVKGKRIGAISVVGEALKDNTEVICRLTDMFRKKGIKIHMMLKGNSLNLIFGINEEDLRPAVNLLYHELAS